jgi:hypothetical protein
MKLAMTLLLIGWLSGPLLAQGVFRNQVNDALEKVVQDYPSQFQNIRGEQLTSGAFKSNIAIPGAISTTITQSAENQKQLIAWKSVVYANTDFSQARSRFEETFNQIRNTVIRAQGEKAVIVNGMFINPSAEQTYTIIQFDLLPPSGLLQKVNIDLSMENTGTQWEIVLNVYDKERNSNAGVVK